MNGESYAPDLHPFIRDTLFPTTVVADSTLIPGLRLRTNSATMTPSRNVGVHFRTRRRYLRAPGQPLLEVLLGSSRSFRTLRCDRPAGVLRCMGWGARDLQSLLA